MGYELPAYAGLLCYESPATAAVLRPEIKDKQRRTQEFCSCGGGQQIQLRTEDRENGDLGAVAP